MSGSAILSVAALLLRAGSSSSVMFVTPSLQRTGAPSATAAFTASEITNTAIPYVKDLTNGGIGRVGNETDILVTSRLERLTSGPARLFGDVNTTTVLISKSGAVNRMFGNLNVGGSTSAVSDGDLATGDGTRELFYDASTNILEIGGSNVTLRVTSTEIGTGKDLTIESGDSLDGIAGSLTIRGGAGLTTDGALNIGITQTSELNLGAGANHWQITAAGNLLAGTDNSWDLGAVGATRPRAGYFGTSLAVGGTTVSETAIAAVGALDIDAAGALALDATAALTLGDTAATSIAIGRTGITTDFPSGSTVDFTGATVTGLPSVGITARRNTGVATSIRPQVNFIEGTNITITVVDDGGSDEIDVTITAASGSISAIYGGVANGTTLGAGSGTYVVANQGNLSASTGWAHCFSVGATAGAQAFVGFGQSKGTGSNQGQVTMTAAGAFNNSNGFLWNGAGCTGSTSAFSGNTFNIGYTTAASHTVGVLAGALGWS